MIFTKPKIFAWAFFILVGLVQPLFAQVSGGNPLLTVSTAVMGSEPVAVTNTSTTLAYSREPGHTTKITVATVCTGQHFTLKVLATGMANGTAAPEVTLTNGMLATDFIRDILKNGNKDNTAILRYTASATFAQGNTAELGNDVHAVSYTLVLQ